MFIICANMKNNTFSFIDTGLTSKKSDVNYPFKNVNHEDNVQSWVGKVSVTMT